MARHCKSGLPPRSILRHADGAPPANRSHKGGRIGTGGEAIGGVADDVRLQVCGELRQVAHHPTVGHEPQEAVGPLVLQGVDGVGHHGHRPSGLENVAVGNAVVEVETAVEARVLNHNGDIGAETVAVEVGNVEVAHGVGNGVGGHDAVHVETVGPMGRDVEMRR